MNTPPLYKRSTPPQTVYVATWKHRHGVDVFVNKTEQGRLHDVINKVVLEYLNEIPNPKDVRAIKHLIRQGKLLKALIRWGECRDDEYVDFHSGTVGK